MVQNQPRHQSCSLRQLFPELPHRCCSRSWFLDRILSFNGRLNSTSSSCLGESGLNSTAGLDVMHLADAAPRSARRGRRFAPSGFSGIDRHAVALHRPPARRSYSGVYHVVAQLGKFNASGFSFEPFSIPRRSASRSALTSASSDAYARDARRVRPGMPSRSLPVLPLPIKSVVGTFLIPLQQIQRPAGRCRIASGGRQIEHERRDHRIVHLDAPHLNQAVLAASPADRT